MVPTCSVLSQVCLWDWGSEELEVSGSWCKPLIALCKYGRSNANNKSRSIVVLMFWAWSRAAHSHWRVPNTREQAQHQQTNWRQSSVVDYHVGRRRNRLQMAHCEMPLPSTETWTVSSHFWSCSSTQVPGLTAAMRRTTVQQETRQSIKDCQQCQLWGLRGNHETNDCCFVPSQQHCNQISPGDNQKLLPRSAGCKDNILDP